MTLQQLEYIVALYRYKHFARAAESCHVTQPTLSSMIQKLEAELGVEIFNRKTQPITPTPVGRQVIEEGWKVLVRARRIKDMVEEEKHSLSGEFRIGILPTIAPYLLPRFFPQLLNSHSDLDIRMHEMKTDDIKKALRSGRLDAAILAETDDMDSFHLDSLFYEQYFAYVAEDDTLYNAQQIKTTDLQGEPLWLLDEGHCFRDQLVKFCHLRNASQAKRAYTLGSIETFMRIVENGRGVTFIPELALYQLTEKQRRLVKPFAVPVPTRHVVMMTNRSFIRRGLLQFIIDSIRQGVPKEMLKLRVTQKEVL